MNNNVQTPIENITDTLQMLNEQFDWFSGEIKKLLKQQFKLVGEIKKEQDKLK